MPLLARRHQSRSQPAEAYLGTANAGSLIPKWIFTTSGDVSATPTVGTTAVFVPDWDGNLFAIDLATGAQLWSHQISSTTVMRAVNASVLPSITTPLLSVTVRAPELPTMAQCNCSKPATGSLLWMTQVDLICGDITARLSSLEM